MSFARWSLTVLSLEDIRCGEEQRLLGGTSSNVLWGDAPKLTGTALAALLQGVCVAVLGDWRDPCVSLQGA